MQKQAQKPTVFDHEAMNQLLETRKLLEELIETMDIAQDKELMEKIKKGEKELDEGKATTLNDILKGK